MADRDENITTRFKADITNLKAGITEANRHIKLANAEFKAAASGMDDWTKSTDGISAKLKNLDTVMSEQKKVLANLEKQYELTKEAQGEDSTAAENLAIKIANQKAAINKTSQEMDHYGDELELVEQAQKNAEKSGGSLEDELEKLKKSADDAGNGFTVMKGALAGLVADGIRSAINGVKNFVVGSIDVGRNFQASMSEVAAISGATGNDLELLSDTAKKFGESTKFSASEAADGLKYMALAGWDAQTSSSALGGVLDLAAASGMELGKASDMVTDYLSAFGMEAEKSSYFADLLAYSQSKSNTSAEQLGEAYKNCAANMNAAGQDIETTTSFLAKMADQGLKGSEAGTALTAIMRDMTAKMKDGSIAIGKTTVKVQDANGNYRDMTDIMKDVEKATNGMGDAQRASALGSTFTADSIKGLNLILNAGVDQAAEFEEQLRSSGGSAKEMADIMNDNLSGDLTTLGSQFEGVQIALYEKFEPALRDGVDILSKLLDGVNFVVEHSSEFIGAITAMAAGMGAYLAYTTIVQVMQGGLMSLSLAQKAAAAAQVVLNAVMSANPIGIVIALIAALVAGLIYFWNKSESFRDAIRSIGEGIVWVFENARDLIIAAWNKVTKFFETVPENIKSFFTNLPGWFKSKFTEAKNKIVEAFSDIKAKFTEILNKIKSVFTADSLKDAGMQLLAGLWNGISNKVEWLKSKVKGVVDKIKSWFTGKEGFDEHSPSKWSEKVMRYVFEGMGKGVVFDSKPVKNVINDVKNVIESGLDKTKDSTKKITESIRDNVSKVVDEVYKSLETAQQNYQKNTESFMNSTKLFDAFSDSVDTTGTRSVELITNLEGQVKGMEQYASILENLKSRVSSDFYDYLKSLGIGEISNLRVLQRMSDTSLKYYESLYHKKYDLSKKLSFDDYQKELETLGVNVNKSLNDIELVAKEAGMKTTLGYAQSLAAAADSSEFKSKIADLTKAIKDAFSEVADSVQTMSGGVTASGKTSNVSTVTNVTNNFNQTNNSPKALSRLTIYRQTKNLLSMKGAQ